MVNRCVRRRGAVPRCQRRQRLRLQRQRRGAHPSGLDPRGVPVRESRDSAEHPRSVAIAVLFDVTGSMRAVPRVLQAKLPQLLGLLARLSSLHHLVDHHFRQRRDTAGRSGRDRDPPRRRPQLPDQAWPRSVRHRRSRPGASRAAQPIRRLAGHLPGRAPGRGRAAVRHRGHRRRRRAGGHPPRHRRPEPAAAVPVLPGRRAAADADSARPGP